MNDILFRPHSGGLGDSVLYSTLPERWARLGHKVYIVNPNWRNPGVPDLIWKPNPFVAGIVEDGFTHIMSDNHKLTNLSTDLENNIKAAEAYFGLTPLSDHPKLYYPFKFKPEFSNKVLIDCRAYSIPFTKEVFEPFVHKLHERGLFEWNQLIMLDSDYPLFYTERLSLGRDDLIFPELPKYKAPNILEWADALFSCQRVLCVTSGTAGIMSAIKGYNSYPKVHVLAPAALLNQRYWKYSNLDYYPTGQLSDDWKEF